MRLARWCYAVAATLFVAGVVVQVYLVGLAVVSGRIGFASHVALGQALALPLIVMLVAASVGRTGRTVVLLSWLLFATYVVQASVVVVRGSLPTVAALHPVLALVDIVLGLVLVRAGWAAVAELRTAPVAAPAEAAAS